MFSQEKTKLFRFASFILFAVLVFSCSSDSSGDEPGAQTDDFDRAEMLVFWADQIIIPAYENYRATLVDLNTAAESLDTVDDLKTLQEKWRAAYLAWQGVSMFDIGKAESNGIKVFSNTYPTDAEQIELNIGEGSYNLELPSRKAEQGLPALDYLINSRTLSDEQILEQFDANRQSYIKALTERLLNLCDQVLEDWTTGDFRSKFIANKGSSSTSSVDKVVNDFLYDFEKYTRAGKVGIPAGVFSSLPIPTASEAYYSGERSKELLLESIKAAKGFFEGDSWIVLGGGPSLKAYLDDLGAQKDGQNLSELILANFNEAENLTAGLSSDFADQIEADNTKMLALYDVLQKNVVLIKVDAMQAMNIQVDYVDADGD